MAELYNEVRSPEDDVLLYRKVFLASV